MKKVRRTCLVTEKPVRLGDVMSTEKLEMDSQPLKMSLLGGSYCLELKINYNINLAQGSLKKFSVVE